MIPRPRGSEVLCAITVAAVCTTLVTIRTRSLRHGQEELQRRIEVGRQLFLQSHAPSGELVGLVDADRIGLRGERMACSSCHGPRALAETGAEAALPPRPTEDMGSLARASARLDATGERSLSRGMSRFPLDPEQLEALRAYLEAVEPEPTPSVALSP